MESFNLAIDGKVSSMWFWFRDTRWPCPVPALRPVVSKSLLSAYKAGSSGGKCELWVWRIPATAVLSNSICMWIMPAVCAVESHRDEHPPIGGSHKCGAGEMHPREGTMMELNLPEGWQRLAGLDGSALCIKVAIERSASGRRMSTLKFSSVVSQR